MIAIIDNYYKLNVTFDLKRSITKARKEKLKNIFHNFKSNRINDKLVIFSNDDEEITIDSQSIFITSKNYRYLKRYMYDILDILEIELNNSNIQIEISVESLINDESKNLDIKELSNIISTLMDINNINNKIINSIEYITLISPKIDKPVNMRLKIYTQGIVVTALMLIKNLDIIDSIFEELIVKIDQSIIELLKFKISGNNNGK